MTSVVLKVVYNEEIRRVAIPVEEITPQNILERIANMFPKLENYYCKYSSNNGKMLDLNELADVKISITDEKQIIRVFIFTEKEEDEEKIEIEEIEEKEKENVEELAQETDINEKVNFFNANTCSECGKDLENNSRFKCLFCIDVLLCTECSHASPEVHPSTHLLVELRCPISALPPQQQLVFLNFIGNTREVREFKRQFRSQIRANLKKEREERRKKRFEERRKKRENRKNKKQAKEEEAEEKKEEINEEGNIYVVQNENDNEDEFEEEEEVPVAIVQEEQQIELNNNELSESIIENENEDLRLEEILNSLEKQETQESWNVFGSLASTFSSLWSGRSAPNNESHRIKGVAFMEKLDALEKMGFKDYNMNVILLAKNLANLERTVEDLVARQNS